MCGVLQNIPEVFIYICSCFCNISWILSCSVSPRSRVEQSDLAECDKIGFHPLPPPSFWINIVHKNNCLEYRMRWMPLSSLVHSVIYCPGALNPVECVWTAGGKVCSWSKNATCATGGVRGGMNSQECQPLTRPSTKLKEGNLND